MIIGLWPTSKYLVLPVHGSEFERPHWSYCISYDRHMKTKTIEPMAFTFQNPTFPEFNIFRIPPKHHPFSIMGQTNSTPDYHQGLERSPESKKRDPRSRATEPTAWSSFLRFAWRWNNQFDRVSLRFTRMWNKLLFFNPSCCSWIRFIMPKLSIMYYINPVFFLLLSYFGHIIFYLTYTSYHLLAKS